MKIGGKSLEVQISINNASGKPPRTSKPLQPFENLWKSRRKIVRVGIINASVLMSWLSKPNWNVFIFRGGGIINQRQLSYENKHCGED